jgi:aryl-alcohol dehydrogenase-like predicted oxidoreductase
MFDTSNVYGRGHNEELVGRFLAGKRDRAIVSTKFGVVRDPNGPSGSTYDRGIDNSAAYMRQCCDNSLKRLRTDYIDLYYVHRLDPDVDVEDVIGPMADLVKEGKIRAIGLSEVSSEILRRANAVHPISALQSEYSLWFRDPEADVIPTCRELGITFVPYSPLGRGFLTGAIKDPTKLAGNDLRLSSPRFQDKNLHHNLELLEKIKDLAAHYGCTLGQIAIAWILRQPDEMIPIPGTKRIKYLEENVGAVSVPLTSDDVRALGEILAPEAIAGSRHWTPSSGTEATG